MGHLVKIKAESLVETFGSNLRLEISGREETVSSSVVATFLFERAKQRVISSS